MKPISLTILALLCMQSSSAAFVKVDDFESGVGAWTVGVNTNFSAVTDPEGGSNQVGALSIGTGTDSGNLYRSLGTTISATSTAATVFYRFYLQDGVSLTNGFNHFTGVSKNAAPGAWSDFTSYMGPRDAGPVNLIARDEPSLVDSGDLSQGQWYNAWIVLDNNGDTADYYVNTGGDATAADLVADDFANRDVANNPIQSLLMRIGPLADDNLVVYYDDFYVDITGRNLMAIPEPSTWAMSCMVAVVAAVMTRRRR